MGMTNATETHQPNCPQCGLPMSLADDATRDSVDWVCDGPNDNTDSAGCWAAVPVEQTQTEIYTLKPGDLLPNGATVIAYASHSEDRGIVLAMRPGMADPYATWHATRESDGYWHTYWGTYCLTIDQAVEKFNIRRHNPMVTGTFRTPYDQYSDRIGQRFTVVRVITEPDDDHDEEVLPMYVIRFDDGVEIEAWPEEVS